MTVVLPGVVIAVLGTEQVTFGKLLETEHENETVPVKLFTVGVTVTVDVLEVPGGIARVAGFAVNLRSTDHCWTRLLASIEPKPVVWSYPTPCGITNETDPTRCCCRTAR